MLSVCFAGRSVMSSSTPWTRLRLLRPRSMWWLPRWTPKTGH